MRYLCKCGKSEVTVYPTTPHQKGFTNMATLAKVQLGFRVMDSVDECPECHETEAQIMERIDEGGE